MRKLALASLAAMALWLGAPAPAHAWSAWSSGGGGNHGGWHGGGGGHGGGGHGWYGGGYGYGRGWYGYGGPVVYFGGGPFWYGYPPYPYGYAYPYAPQVIVQPPAPQVYVQPSGGAQQQYWYYCQSPAGYYPSVTQCPGGWIQVVPNSVPGGQ
jgi:hypothetical protein